MLSYFFFPFLYVGTDYLRLFASSVIETPIPSASTVGDVNFINTFNSPNGAQKDSENAANWYSVSSRGVSFQNRKDYELTIPKLKIEKAVVSTKDYNLSKHLVQYNTTTFPGENGTIVILGHSNIPQLYNPKNYRVIFATLHTLQINDEIFIESDGVKYKYTVYAVEVTDKNDMSIFSQVYNNSYMNLVTCFPPGTLWKRLVIKSQMSSY